MFEMLLLARCLLCSVARPRLRRKQTNVLPSVSASSHNLGLPPQLSLTAPQTLPHLYPQVLRHSPTNFIFWRPPKCPIPHLATPLTSSLSVPLPKCYPPTPTCHCPLYPEVSRVLELVFCFLPQSVRPVPLILALAAQYCSLAGAPSQQVLQGGWGASLTTTLQLCS